MSMQHINIALQTVLPVFALQEEHSLLTGLQIVLLWFCRNTFPIWYIGFPEFFGGFSPVAM